MNIKDIFYTWDHRLNDPVWMLKQLQTPYMPYEIANMIGCSEELVNRKIEHMHLFECKDTIFNTYTGYFHYTKKFITPLLRPYIKKISQGIDTIFDRCSSKNSKIFKKILQELDELDKDHEPSALAGLGMNRKEGYILAMKFMICLYEYDSYYIERMEYIMKRIMEEKENINVDNDVANPDNWYPNRNIPVFTKFMMNRYN